MISHQESILPDIEIRTPSVMLGGVNKFHSTQNEVDRINLKII